MESSNAKVLGELKLLNEKSDKLTEDVAMTQNENLLLFSRLADMKRPQQTFVFKTS